MTQASTLNLTLGGQTFDMKAIAANKSGTHPDIARLFAALPKEAQERAVATANILKTVTEIAPVNLPEGVTLKDALDFFSGKSVTPVIREKMLPIEAQFSESMEALGAHIPNFGGDKAQKASMIWNFVQGAGTGVALVPNLMRYAYTAAKTGIEGMTESPLMTPEQAHAFGVIEAAVRSAAVEEAKKNKGELAWYQSAGVYAGAALDFTAGNTVPLLQHVGQFSAPVMNFVIDMLGMVLPESWTKAMRDWVSNLAASTPSEFKGWDESLQARRESAYVPNAEKEIVARMEGLGDIAGIDASASAVLARAMNNGGAASIETMGGAQKTFTASGGTPTATQNIGADGKPMTRENEYEAAKAPVATAMSNPYMATAAVTTGGLVALGTAQGFAQSVLKNDPDHWAAKGAQRLLNATGAGEEMGNLARFNNKYNIFQRLPRIFTRGGSDLAFTVTDTALGAVGTLAAYGKTATKYGAAAAVEMLNGNVLATGAAAQTIGETKLVERVLGQTDAMADAHRFVENKAVTNVLSRGGKRFFRVLGPVGSAIGLTMSADALANGTAEEKQSETGALALMGSGAAIGAGIGVWFGGIGAAPGAAIGGTVGGIVSIAEPISSKVGEGMYWAGGKVSSAYNYMFGPSVDEKLTEVAALQDRTLMKYMDRNADGKLTGEEVKTYLVQSRAELPTSAEGLDRDGDGRVDSHDVYLMMSEAHRKHGMDPALQTAVVQAEMAARNVRMQAAQAAGESTAFTNVRTAALTSFPITGGEDVNAASPTRPSEGPSNIDRLKSLGLFS